MRDDSLIDALECYQHHPDKLTRGHVALLTKADPVLGEKAGERRREARAQVVVDAVVLAIKHALAPRDAKIAALEARLLEVEADRAVKRELVP